jgi:arabinogalactan endo-1,4-beta-galactosidase
MINKLISITLVALLLLVCCSSNDNPSPVKPEPVDSTTFLFGADLSYVNQILEKGGVYRRNGNTEDPYQIFAAAGANLSRFRLWHNPTWTKTVYGEAGERLYSDLTDVEQSIKYARQNGMRILLDLHYSDTWADPGHQPIPAAWMGITSISVLKDSVYSAMKQIAACCTQRLLKGFRQAMAATVNGSTWVTSSTQRLMRFALFLRNQQLKQKLRSMSPTRKMSIGFFQTYRPQLRLQTSIS